MAEHTWATAIGRAAERVESRTLWHGDRFTKTLTAVALLQLVERGRVSLDDPVAKWVPEVRLSTIRRARSSR